MLRVEKLWRQRCVRYVIIALGNFAHSMSELTTFTLLYQQVIESRKEPLERVQGIFDKGNA